MKKETNSFFNYRSIATVMKFLYIVRAAKINNAFM